MNIYVSLQIPSFQLYALNHLFTNLTHLLLPAMCQSLPGTKDTAVTKTDKVLLSWSIHSNEGGRKQPQIKI